MTPIYSTERKRRKDPISQLISYKGSGYEYYQVQTGSTTEIHWRKEQREIKTLRCGIEQFGDWVVIDRWTTVG